jgi:hypothetical protein
MTLDEAIIHCMEEYTKNKDSNCECAEDHLQLAKWLSELHQLRKEANKPHPRPPFSTKLKG